MNTIEQWIIKYRSKRNEIIIKERDECLYLINGWVGELNDEILTDWSNELAALNTIISERGLNGSGSAKACQGGVYAGA